MLFKTALIIKYMRKEKIYTNQTKAKYWKKGMQKLKKSKITAKVKIN